MPGPAKGKKKHFIFQQQKKGGNVAVQDRNVKKAAFYMTFKKNRIHFVKGQNELAF